MPSNEGYGGQRMVPADSLIAANSNYSTIFKLIEAVKDAVAAATEIAQSSVALQPGYLRSVNPPVKEPG
jgi:DhnA family fructose-bisphosphate aldolase class Ia